LPPPLSLSCRCPRAARATTLLVYCGVSHHLVLDLRFFRHATPLAAEFDVMSKLFSLSLHNGVPSPFLASQSLPPTAVETRLLS